MYYETLSKEALTAECNTVKAEYESFRARGIALDMSRGKPGPEQLDLSHNIFNAVTGLDDIKNEAGTD